MSHIKFTIDRLGNPSIEAVGFVGGKCKLATAPFEARLGGTAAVTDKPELHQTEIEQEQHLNEGEC